MFHDISHETTNHYTLDTPGRQIFVCVNRSVALTFDLAVPGAEALVYALFIGKNADDFSLQVIQHHQAPDTRSRLLVKSVLSNQAKFSYTGLIKIDHAATRSDAEQINRNLLLSKKASAFSQPELEILTDDVNCRHAATTTQANEDVLHYLASRGLDRPSGIHLVAEGFIADFFETVRRLGDFPELEAYTHIHLS